MAFFGLRLPDDLAARFDAMAASQGGRSALLRGLVDQALRNPKEEVVVPSPRERTTARIEVRLTATDIERLDAAASERGLKRTEWIVALLRRRLFGKSPPPQPDRALISQSWRELNRIGINLNQAVRALNAATMVDSGLDLAREAARVASFQEEIDGQLRALGRALAGDVSYWDTPA
jgi:metal-responsive CopG/Arc/MetJ family transcriptional regulator